MGIFLAALAAAGDAGVQSMNQNIQNQNQLDLQNNQAGLQATADQRRSDLELQKAKDIADYNEQLKNAPLQRFSDVAAQKANEQVPVEAPPVTKLSASDKNSGFNYSANPQNNNGEGLSIDATPNLLASINALPDNHPEKSDMLLQINRQLQEQKQAAIDSVQGQTRPRNSDEVIRDSLAQLRTTDPKAYADAMASGVLQSKYITVAKDTTLFDPTTNKPIYTNNSGQDAADEKEDRKDQRQQSLFEHQMNLQDKRESLKAKNVQDKNDPWKIFTDANGDQVQGLPHGDEFLNMLPSAAQEQVKALSEGRLTLPSGAALRSPSAQNLIAAVAQYDPSFDTANVGARSATRKDFTSGKAATSINAINTVMKHLDEYVNSGLALDNSSFKAWNYLGNKAIDATGDPRLVRFKTARNAVVDEVERAYRGSGGSQAGIDAWKESMSENMSPASIVESGKTLVKLLDGKLEALADQYTKGMGVTKNGLDLLSPSAKSTYNKLMGINDNSQPSQTSTNQPSDTSSGWSNLRVH